MKIAIVLNTSWNIYNFRMGLIGSLIKHGHEVIAIAPEDEYSGKLEEAGCQYEKVTMDSRGANPLKDMALTYELYRIYKRVRPDVILHFTIKPNIYGTFAARLLNIPAINNVCGLGTVFLKKGLVSIVAKFMYKLAFRYPKKILFQNNEDCELFIRCRIINQERSDIVPGSGIDIQRFLPGNFERKEDFTFLLISRLIKDKGIYEFIEAIRKLRDKGIMARFKVVGAIDEQHKRGIPASHIQSWIDEGLIDYRGRANDVREYIRQADCVLLPSYREGTPRTLLEAASMGKPIITTDVAGCNNVVIDRYNGLLCRLKDPDDLAAKMEMMLTLPANDRRKMGINGRHHIEQNFDEHIVIDKYLYLIDHIGYRASA